MSDAFTPAPVFVVGYMHSGTTLMYKILGRSSTLFTSKGESKYFELMPMLRRRFPDLSSDDALRGLVEYTLRDLLDGFVMSDLVHGQRDGAPAAAALASDVDLLLEQARANRDYGAVFRIVFDHLAKRAGKPRWMEKTPTHVFHIDKILEAVPTARFIEITRDPRDVLASKKTRTADVSTSKRYSDDERARKRLEKAFDPLWDALSWKSAVAAGRRARTKYPDRVFHVLYEDLVTAPEQTVRELCAFLGLDFEPTMIDVPGGNAADFSGRKEGIYASSLKRWQKALTPAEVALSQSVLKRELGELGYDAEPIAIRARVEAIWLLLKALEALVSRIVRRWRMGGSSYLRNVLRDYGERLAVLVTAKR